MMRSIFDEQLDLLNSSLISMGASCECAIACAVKSLLGKDMALAKKAKETEAQIDRKEREIESLCMRLLLSQQPVARDLRLISSAMKMVTDMERIGDQAADIAELIEFVDLSYVECSDHISQMAEAVIKMVTDSVNAFVRRDVSAAGRVIADDDRVDRLFVEIKKDLTALIATSPESGESALDTMMVAKYLERIGDHATNLAEWVVFAVRGEHIGDD